ncbi:MFS transporter [Variovorax sp. PCZ-1]|uniref:MFS transporter n=1 Tax=Variovorax sp. PCZ-1 TaxID=2835533 RepID=UPI001BCBBF08|nr:MFS transporter [Variovorax sp. PCZ-1]MBS7808299.1 MFS transporter [Variovorax sp. PCZ-1]
MALFDSLSPSLARLIIGHISLHSAMAGMRMAAPLWSLDQKLGAFTAGLLVALFALTQVFIALPAGRYADRHGLKRPVYAAVAASCAGALLACAFPHVITLAISALLVGGSTGVTIIALQRHVGRAAHSTVELKQAFSWLSIGPAGANFFGPLLAGVLIDLAGYRAAFGAMALLPLICFAMTRQVSEPPSQAQREAEGEQATAKKPRAAWDLLREPMFARLLLVNWLLSASWDVHGFVVPLIGFERSYSASVIGMILGAFAIAAAVVRILLPLLAHSLREWAVITFAMVMTCLLLAVYPLMPTALSMGVVSVFLGFVLGTVQPMIMSTLHQITPEERHGEAIALRLMAINASSVAMPLLFGLVGTAIGSAALFWIAALMVGSGARLAFKLRT